jgi:hypothetical protein
MSTDVLTTNRGGATAAAPPTSASIVGVLLLGECVRGVAARRSAGRSLTAAAQRSTLDPREPSACTTSEIAQSRPETPLTRTFWWAIGASIA